ncbi:hypothetical protein MUP32_04035 [Candidatus Microgenomates bacterium]|nr:hypothetical protein [Candidatus Microgenomates bacterium]
MKNIIKLVCVCLLFLLLSFWGYSQSLAVSSQTAREEETATQSCPQFMPPHPDVCKDGEWINGGIDEKGCPKPPICSKKSSETQSCQAGCVCENGTMICASSDGQPIKTDIVIQDTSTCPANCDCSGDMMICSSQTNIDKSEITPLTSPSFQAPVGTMPSLVSKTPITIEKNSDGLKINIGSTQIRSQEAVSIINSHLVITASSGQIPIKAIKEENMKSLLKADRINNISLAQVNTMPNYLVDASRQVKILFFFPNSMEIRATVDAVSGLITEIKKPWWEFLTR